MVVGRTVSDRVIEQMSFAYKQAKKRANVNILNVQQNWAQSLVYGIMTEPLSAPDSIFSTPTSAVIHRLARFGNVGTELSLLGGFGSTYETDYVRVWNHDPSLTKESGDLVVCGWVLGELTVLGSGGGGGATIILFQVTSADCANSIGTGIVTGITCGVGTPELGDSVDLKDAMACWLVGREIDLIGRIGAATKMDTGEGYPEEECKWVIISMCKQDFGC